MTHYFKKSYFNKSCFKNSIAPISHQWRLLLALLLLISGCSTPPPQPEPPVREPQPPILQKPEETVNYWYQRTTTENTNSGNYQVIKTRPQTERWPGEDIRWLLRSYKGDNNRVAHQLYVKVRYKGEWRTYTSANFDRKGTRAVNILSKGTGSCEHGCINNEEFTVDLTTDELRALAAKPENRLELKTRFPNLSTLLLIPGVYLQGHLQKYLESQ